MRETNISPAPKCNQNLIQGIKLKAELQNKIIMRGLTLSAGNEQMVTYKSVKILLTRGFIGEFSSLLMHKIPTDRESKRT